MQPKILIVILNWNGLEDTSACLSSLQALHYTNYEVIVIDNCSMNDELGIIHRAFPDVIGVRNHANLGFAGGCNLGIRHALQNNGEYIWLLNNDTRVLPDTLTGLANKMMMDRSIGMISPVIYDRKQESIKSCGTIIQPDTLTRRRLTTTYEYKEFEKKQPGRVALWGTALLIRSKMIEQVGFFDEKYFAYFEDFDLSLRCTNNGWKSIVDVSSSVLHGKAAAGPAKHKYYYMTRNEFIFLVKHSQLRYRSRNIRNHLARALNQAAGLRDHGEMESSKIVLDGVWHAYRNIYGEWKNKNRMPDFLARFILWHPYLLSRLLGAAT